MSLRTSSLQYDIFISHTSQEVDLAVALKDRIQTDFADFEIFVSSDETSISTKSEWMNQIKAALGTIQLMIVLCSSDSLKRPWISFEAGAAWLQEIDLIPFCHDGLSPGELPSPYAAFQAAGINDRGIGILYENIARIFSKRLDRAKISPTVLELEAASKQLARKKTTSKRLREADSVGAICYKIDGHANRSSVLLVKTSSMDRWIFPKGKIMQNNDIFATLIRELDEEAGVVGDIDRDRPIFLNYTKGDNTQKNLVLYPVRVKSERQPKEKKRTPSWVAPDKVLKRLHEGRERDPSFAELEAAYGEFQQLGLV